MLPFFLRRPSWQARRERSNIVSNRMKNSRTEEAKVIHLDRTRSTKSASEQTAAVRPWVTPFAFLRPLLARVKQLACIAPTWQFHEILRSADSHHAKHRTFPSLGKADCCSCFLTPARLLDGLQLISKSAGYFSLQFCSVQAFLWWLEISVEGLERFPPCLSDNKTPAHLHARPLFGLIQNSKFSFKIFWIGPLAGLCIWFS